LGIFLKNPPEIVTVSAGKIVGKHTWRIGSPHGFSGSRVTGLGYTNFAHMRVTTRRKPLLGPSDFSSGRRSWVLGSHGLDGFQRTGLSSRVAGLRGSAPGFHRKSPSNSRISALVRRNRHWTAVRRLCALHDGSRVSAPGSLSISQSLFPSQSP
jgi:hypothetical protein